jgi:hypothetical protein
MPNYANPRSIILVFGAGECGKTGFAIKYVLNVPASCRFIFDHKGQIAHRLKLKACGTAAECEAAVPTGWVVFNPFIMFQAHQLVDAFRWFCFWAMQVSDRDNGQHKKILFVDELWELTDNRTLPVELETIVRTGRHVNLEFLSCTHQPREYHVLIRSQVTEFVAFNTVEPYQLEAIRPYWSGVDQAAALGKGEFIAVNRESRAELRGRLF